MELETKFFLSGLLILLIVVLPVMYGMTVSIKNLIYFISGLFLLPMVYYAGRLIQDEH